MKKFSKLIALAAVGVMVAALGIFGCSSGSSSASSASASASASSASASTSASSAAATEMKLLESGKLIIGTSPDFPPFENLENGEFVGLDMEIAKAIGEKLGLEVEFKSLQFDAIIPAVAAGGQVDCGISGFTVDPERAKEIDFSTTYYIDDQAIAAMKDSAITAENVDEALAKATVAVQSGTSGEAYIQENYPEATIQPYGNSTDAFAAMQAGQADAVCTNAAVVNKMLAEAYQDAVVVKSIATGEEYAMVVAKDNPALTKALNEAIAELEADGTLQRLIETWM
ncbi:MAG: amino acid ABC transporter substrate-binding protein [Eggerthellaceae bacterium]|nr:amino acid ABC transporter substrate-binding protein [Eggerthellaceae bacterium]